MSARNVLRANGRANGRPAPGVVHAVVPSGPTAGNTAAEPGPPSTRRAAGAGETAGAGPGPPATGGAAGWGDGRIVGSAPGWGGMRAKSPTVAPPAGRHSTSRPASGQAGRTARVALRPPGRENSSHRFAAG